jgi:hypothetical protein
MNEEGCGIGTGLRPGGALIGGPGEGVPTGPPAPAYGFVTKDVSDTIESTGSRRLGCLPVRFDGGESPGGPALRPPFSPPGERCSGGAPGARPSVEVMFVVVTGG